MEIQLIKFKNKSFSLKDTKEDKQFIEELNDVLFDNDFVLVDESKDPILKILFVESDNIDDQMEKADFSSIHPHLILVGRHPTALKGALDLNAYLMLHDYDPLLIIEKEASLMTEFAKVMALKHQIKDSHLLAVGSFRNNAKNSVLDLEKKFGIEVHRITKKKFFDYYNNIDVMDIPHQDIINKFINNEDDLIEIKKLYHTLKYFFDLYNIRGLAIDIKELNHLLPFVASLFNEKGYSVIIDNDLTSLFSLHILNSISETNALYASLMKFEFEHERITLLIKNPPLNVLNNEQGLTKGEVTLSKIGLNHSHIYSFNGKIVDSKILDEHSLVCSIEVKGRELFTIFNEPLGGSIALTYGDYLGNLLAFDNIMMVEDRKY